MKQKNRFLLWFSPALILFALGLACATVWDLPIAKAIYGPNLFGILMEAYCWYPAFLPALFFAILLITQPKALRPHPILPVGGWCVLIIGMAGMALMSANYFRKRGLFSGDSSLMFGILLAVLIGLGIGIVIVSAVLLAKTSTQTREKLYTFAIFGTVYAIFNQVIIYALKFMWQRPRFDDMLATGNFDSFTPWYHPFSSGGNSFPSGHTANAAGVFVLIILCDLFPAWHKRRKLVYAVCWAYIAVSGFSRMQMGRHFLSDVLVACTIMALLFFAMRSTGVYQNILRRVKGVAANTAGGIK